MLGSRAGVLWLLLGLSLKSVVALIEDFDADIAARLSFMTIEEKVGQMTQINVDQIFTCNETTQEIYIDREKLRPWLHTWKIGSLLNSPYAGNGLTCGDYGWSAESWRKAIVVIQLVLLLAEVNNFGRVQEEAADAGLPPVLFGLDSIHGANYVKGAVMFPQQISMAATLNREMGREFGFITGRDTRAAGIPWMFSPILGISTQPLWPRVYETFGEDPLVAAEMGKGVIQGMQTPAPPGEYPARAAACAKHYIGYSDSRTGHDRAPAWIPKRHLLQYYAPPFQAAVDAGVLTMMESYSEVDGVPMASNEYLLKELLRDEMKFKGMMVTDWAETNNLNWFHKVAASVEDAVWLSMNKTTIDMSMVPSDSSFGESLVKLVKAGIIPESRITESAGRVLQLKKEVGLLDVPIPSEESELTALVGSQDDVEKSRDMAREAIVLLKNGDGAVTPMCCRGASGTDDNGIAVSLDWLCNSGQVTCDDGWESMNADEKRAQFSKFADEYFQKSPAEVGRCDFGGTAEAYQCGETTKGNGILPLTESSGRLLVVGPTADSLSSLSAGWTIHWQGVSDDSQFSHGTTILQGLREVYDPSKVEYKEGCKFGGESHATQTCEAVDMEGTMASAAAADVIVVCLGEESYTEKPGDIDDLQMHAGQIELITELNKAGKPMVLVLVAGRPRQLEGVHRLSNVHSVIHALVPGPEGGLAVAEVMLGLVNPSGRMPITYPATTSTIHYPHWHAVSSQCVGSQVFLSATTQSCPVDFVFGQGLSYSTFEYTGFKWYTGAHFSGTQEAELEIGSSLTVEFTVENTGAMDANHSVLLYYIQAYRRVTPETDRLLGFDKVFVGAGESKVVQFTLSTSDFSYIGVDFDRVVETGDYTLALGDSQYGAAPAPGNDCTDRGHCLGARFVDDYCPGNVATLSAVNGALCSSNGATPSESPTPFEEPEEPVEPEAPGAPDEPEEPDEPENPEAHGSDRTWFPHVTAVFDFPGLSVDDAESDLFYEPFKASLSEATGVAVIITEDWALTEAVGIITSFTIGARRDATVSVTMWTVNAAAAESVSSAVTSSVASGSFIASLNSNLVSSGYKGGTVANPTVSVQITSVEESFSQSAHGVVIGFSLFTLSMVATGWGYKMAIKAREVSDDSDERL